MQDDQAVSGFQCLHHNLASLWIQAARFNRQIPREKAIALAAFTLNDCCAPILFAGANTDGRVDMHVAPPDTDPRAHVYLCVSGEKPININYEPEMLPANYPRLALAIRCEQEHRLLDLCDQAVKFSSDRSPPDSEYLSKALQQLTECRLLVSNQLQKQEASDDVTRTPFHSLACWLQGLQMTNYTVPVRAMAILRQEPGPFRDAEQQLMVSLYDARSVAAVRAAMTASEKAIKTVYLHIYTNLECCDYCCWMLLNSYHRLKSEYAAAFGAEFYLVLSGHARFRHDRMATKGVVAMHNDWPDEDAKKHVILLPIGLTI